MLPNHTLVVEDFDEFRDLIKSWIEGHYELMVVLGEAGLGKSETIERMMEELQGKPNKMWAYIKGKITPLKLYQCLYDFKRFPIVINDVDTLLKDETNVSLLKCVCDTSKVKTVEWTSSHAAFGTLPKRFESISQMLVITNSLEKVNQNITALHNRGVVIHFKPSALEIHSEVGVGDWFDDREVWEFIGKHLYLMTKPDFRFYLHARHHKQAGHDWKDLTLRMMGSSLDDPAGQTREQKERLIYVAKLLADPKFDAMPAPETEREQTFRLAFGKGCSRASYYRNKKTLRERQGQFDADAVAKITWKDPGEDRSAYDEKQSARRKALEEERRVLEQAGGVHSETDDDDDA